MTVLLAVAAVLLGACGPGSPDADGHAGGTEEPGDAVVVEGRDPANGWAGATLEVRLPR